MHGYTVDISTRSPSQGRRNKPPPSLTTRFPLVKQQQQQVSDSSDTGIRRRRSPSILPPCSHSTCSSPQVLSFASHAQLIREVGVEERSLRQRRNQNVRLRSFALVASCPSCQPFQERSQLQPKVDPQATKESMPPILHLPSISSLLLQLISPEASPHTALLITSTGAIISLQSVEPEAPWPNYGLGEKGKEARGRMYSALAAAEWKEEGLTEGVLKLEMEVSWLDSRGACFT